MVDCDGLKTANDTGGHELGDRVLQPVARCLRTNKRLEDVAARLGEDEFAVLIRGADGETGAGIAERFRRELGRTPHGLDHPIAATFGVASFPADGSTPADLVRAADRALYLAKERRGNQTLVLTARAESASADSALAKTPKGARSAGAGAVLHEPSLF
jgi:diguanylate cyclase (GGDEF)-like protein